MNINKLITIIYKITLKTSWRSLRGLKILMGGNNRNMGGTIRTVELMCGFKIKGDPGRLDLQLRLHKKKCEEVNVTY